MDLENKIHKTEAISLLPVAGMAVAVHQVHTTPIHGPYGIQQQQAVQSAGGALFGYAGGSRYYSFNGASPSPPPEANGYYHDLDEDAFHSDEEIQKVS